MTTASVKISGHEVIASGSVVSFQDEEVTLYPLSSDPEFFIRFKILLSEDVSTSIMQIDNMSSNDKGVYFRIKRKLETNVIMSPSRPLVFATEDDDSVDYYIALALQAFGTDRHHTIILNYTVTSRPHQEGF